MPDGASARAPCGISEEELRALLALALSVRPLRPSRWRRAAPLATVERAWSRRARARARWLTALASLCAASLGTSSARADSPVAPVAELERFELVRGEITEWCGGFALEHPRWNASVKLHRREERIGAGGIEEHELELSIGRALGRRFSIDASSRFDLALRPAGAALELSFAF